MAGNYNYYLWIDGVRGDSKDRAHPGWIPIRSFQWGLAPAGTGGGHRAGTRTPGLQDAVFIAPADRSWPVLMLACATGVGYRSARLDGISPNGASRLLLTFNEVMVASFRPAGDGNEFSLTASSYEMAGGMSESSIKSRQSSPSTRKP